LYTKHKVNNDLLSRYGATMVARQGFLIASSYVGRDIVVAECPNLDRCSNLSGIGETRWRKVWESDCCDPKLLRRNEIKGKQKGDQKVDSDQLFSGFVPGGDEY
jgi:hypothetical protein